MKASWVTVSAQVEPSDTLIIGANPSDSLILNVNSVDSIIPEDDFGIEFPVYTDAADSTIMDVEQEIVYLYRDAVIKYGDMELKAAYIEFNFKTFVVKAKGVPDSTGALMGKPVFKQGSNEFTEDSLLYNFKTKQGITYLARTREGDAYLITEKSKIHANKWVHVRNGMFTTCSNEKPHYHFRLSRAIAIPNDKVVSGPLFMKVGNVPTPLALPFGFFPNKRESTHGILLPGYGNADSKGYFLQNLGYYIPVNDYIDTKLLFDIYTRGSWSMRNITGYKKIYQYSGNFNLSRTINVSGIPELSGYSKRKDFNIQWTHNQDPKARPNSRLSASVNLGTSTNFRNNINTSQQDFLSSTFGSSIQWSKSFHGKPYSLAANARHSQNTQTKNVDVLFPSLTFNLSRVNLPLFDGNPEKGKAAPKWISPIGINGTIVYENSVNAGDSLYNWANFNNLRKGARSGIRLNANASSSLKLFSGIVTANPTISYSEYMAFKYLDKTLNDFDGSVVTDTIQGIRTARNWNASINANTRMFGTFVFRNAEKLKAIRHVINPSIGASYTPYNNNRIFGFFGANGDFIGYSPFDVARFSPSQSQEAANINYSINQNLEAKVADKSAGQKKGATKKITLIESFRTSASYNMLADSLKWSNLSTSAFTTIAKIISINYNGTFSMYDRDSLGRDINTFLPGRTDGRWFRMESTNLAAGFGLNSKLFQSKKKPTTGDSSETDNGLTTEENEIIQNNPDEFVNFNMPWNLNVNYNLRISKQWQTAEQRDKSVLTQAATFDGDIVILKKWAIGFDSGYDFNLKKFTTTNINFSWDLHCWEFSFSWVPFGDRKSYMAQLNIKSPLLQDLKIQQRGRLGRTDELLY
jgi:hypothetical protein